jgi:hypothetical protein
MSSQPRRVFLHVGSPKTGTTFLQQVLWSQRDRALEQGLLLPLERFADHFLASLDVRGLADRPEHPERAVGIWQQVVEEAEAWPGTVLVSHELFAAATAEQAQRAVAAFGPDTEVHVVVTARDLVRQIPAEWQEHVKHRSTKTFGEFVDDLRADTGEKSWFWKVQDYAGVLERWSKAVPTDRVHVVTVPPPGADSGLLWVRFATLLGLDPGTFETTRSRSNPSLGVEQTELLRRFNASLGDRLPLPGPYPRVVKNVLAHRVLAGRPGDRIVLDRQAHDFAVTRSREIADRLADLGVNVVGSLDELVPDPVGAESEPVPAPSEDVLLDESLAAMAGLLEALADRKAEQRYEELVQRLRDRPLRFAMLRLSERHASLMVARRGYERLRGRKRQT